MPFCVECGGALPPTPTETTRPTGVVGMTVLMSVICLLLAALLAAMFG